ncbi:MAG TPA: hypothetical protein EYQ83_11070 [Acidobacteria bacterium]|nr:hypothetical protein [Acidobacteriota bacterium]
MSPALLQPVLFGGLFMGVLSALPIISIGNCCCLWIMGGGMVTSYLTQHGQTEPIQLGEGAFGGFLAGVLGAVVYAVVSVPVSLVTAPIQRSLLEGWMNSAADVPPEAREMLERFSENSGVLGVLFGFILMLVVGTVFTTLGGLLGALIFRSSPPVAPPAPPLPPPATL